MDLLSLYSKPISQQFTEEEIRFLKKKLPKYRWLVKYAIYKPKSSRGESVMLIIDQMPNAVRRSGVENKWEVICTRPLSQTEYDYVIGNYGTLHQRFLVWFFKSIEQLIEDDLPAGINTPQEFIKVCRDRGFSNSYQTSINF